MVHDLLYPFRFHLKRLADQSVESLSIRDRAWRAWNAGPRILSKGGLAFTLGLSQQYVRLVWHNAVPPFTRCFENWDGEY
jgi:hypothetical protein